MADTGYKKDEHKDCRPSLIAPEFIDELGKVLKFGADKYEAGNWAKGMDWSRLVDALERHLIAWKKGEVNDPESGLHHLAHAAFGFMVLVAYEKRGIGGNDLHENGTRDLPFTYTRKYNVPLVNPVNVADIKVEPTPPFVEGDEPFYYWKSGELYMNWYKHVVDREWHSADEAYEEYISYLEKYHERYDLVSSYRMEYEEFCYNQTKVWKDYRDQHTVGSDRYDEYQTLVTYWSSCPQFNKVANKGD